MASSAPRLELRLSDHQAAVREFIERASALGGAQWLTPRAEGKWTPAQETRHVILTYEAFLRELKGGAPMRLRGNRWKRRLWRWIGLSQILWRKRIPVAVHAPREIRPELEVATSTDLLAQLADRAEDFDVTFAKTWRSEPRRRVTHPLFGQLTLDHVIRLLSVHTRHHAAFLPNPQPTSSA
jgi:uncharacterized damage-inducible protein DinB